MDMSNPANAGHSRRGGPQVSMSRRHTRGRAHFAQTIAWWITRSQFSYRQMQVLADWATGERRILIPSQIAHLRHANLRSPTLTLFDALHELNCAIHQWHHATLAEVVEQYGPLPAGVTHAILDSAVWLPQPDHDNPLTYCQWVELFTGRLQLPYVDSITLSDREAVLISEELAELINSCIAALQLGPRDGIDRFLAAYPVSDKARQARLRDLVLLGRAMDPDEIEDELAALAVAVSSLRSLPEGSYGPGDLYAELVAGRRRV
jgi:hypothetical protein